jgi:hypothetical protein
MLLLFHQPDSNHLPASGQWHSVLLVTGRRPFFALHVHQAYDMLHEGVCVPVILRVAVLSAEYLLHILFLKQRNALQQAACRSTAVVKHRHLVPPWH